MKGRVWSDADLLTVLDIVARGRTLADVGRVLRVSRFAAVGALKRLRDDYAASEADPLPPGWPVVAR